MELCIQRVLNGFKGVQKIRQRRQYLGSLERVWREIWRKEKEKVERTRHPVLKGV